MKNIFVGVLFFFSLFGVFFPTNAQLIGPTFSATPSGTTITATLSGIPATLPLSQFTYILDTKEVTSIPLNVIPGLPGATPTKTPVNGSISWTITGLKGDTTYHIRILETPPTPQPKRFATANTTVKTGSAGEVYFTEAQFKKEGDAKFILSGTVVADKHKPSDPAPLSTITISGGFYDKTTKDLILQLTPTKPDDKGAYTFLINNPFNNNTNYDLKLSFDSTTGAHGEHTYTVNTGKGYIIPETGKARENFINKNSYRLLAPIPGMTMLLDPELCKLEQEKNPGEICDINAFLNFLLQLAIGAAAVVLVVRIIIDGYGYMISDMPFVKAKLKGRFIDAMIGLVIALSSYLILNTISPRLVSNDIRIGEVAFDVEEMGTDLPASQVQGSFLQGNLSLNTKDKLSKMPLPTGVLCPGETGGKGDVTTIALSFMKKVTYNNTPQRGTAGPQGTILLDCSLYVNTVLGCAGVTPKTADFTGDMFNKGEKITGAVEVRSGVGYINGKPLKAGDLVGVYDPNGTGAHHVWIYIGNGEILDAQTNKRAVGQSVISKEKLEPKVYGYKLNFVVRY
jgi:hypothetical protein